MESSRDVPHANTAEGEGNERKPLRGDGEGCQRACHLCFSTAVLHQTHGTSASPHGTAASQWICQAPARDAEKSKFYQYQFLAQRRLLALTR